MKTRAFILLNTIVIVITIAVAMVVSLSNDKEIYHKLHQMELEMDERNYIDSLYWEHGKECSFISKDEVCIDSRGYFYSDYHKNHK